MEAIRRRTGQLCFKKGRFFEKIIYIPKNPDNICVSIAYQDITEEVINTICSHLKDRGW